MEKLARALGNFDVVDSVGPILLADLLFQLKFVNEIFVFYLQATA